MAGQNRTVNISIDCNGNSQRELCKQKIITETIQEDNEWIMKVNDCIDESLSNNNLFKSEMVNNNKPQEVKEIIELKIHTSAKKNGDRNKKKEVCKEGKDKDKWPHDLYNEEEQKPITAKELINRYGYDIRSRCCPPPLSAIRTIASAMTFKKKKQRQRQRNRKHNYDDLISQSLQYKTDVEEFALQPPARKRPRSSLPGDFAFQFGGEEPVDKIFYSIMATATRVMAHTLRVVEAHMTQVRNNTAEAQLDAARELKRAVETVERLAAELVRTHRGTKWATSSETVTVTTSGDDEVD